MAVRSIGSALTIALLLTGCGSGEPLGSNQTAADAGVPAPDGPGSDHLTPARRKAEYLNPRGRPPLGRPLDAVEERLLSINDPAERAQEAIKAHKLGIADNVIASLTEESRDDPVWQDIRRLNEAEGQAEIGSSVSEDFPAKVKADWLPQVKGMSLSEPLSVDEVWKREGFFELMAANLDGDRLVDEQGKPKPDTSPLGAARKALRAALASKQSQLFPIMRRAFVKLSAARMWENNVEVAGIGRRIIYTAPIFADNASVQAAYEASASELRKLRFSQAEYAWYHGGRPWSYDLKPPPDNAVGVWPGVSSGEFEPVK